jgi:hypothetical protein
MLLNLRLHCHDTTDDRIRGTLGEMQVEALKEELENVSKINKIVLEVFKKNRSSFMHLSN